MVAKDKGKRELIDPIDRTPEYEAFLNSLQAFYDSQKKWVIP